MLNAPERGCEAFDLFGNTWTCERGHRLVVEITQSDAPFLRRDNIPSTLIISSVALDIPVV